MPGFHCWPTAPDHRSYLARKHRHLFHIHVVCDAAVDDKRELEFHDLQDDVRTIWNNLGGARSDFLNYSCETIAARIGEKLAGHHLRRFVVTVSEDGECGATVAIDWPFQKEGPRQPAEAL